MGMVTYRGRSVLAALALALALPALAPAATGDQPFPRAVMHVAGVEQKGRLVEAQYSQPAGQGLCVTANGLGDGTYPEVLELEPGHTRLRFRVNAERRPEVSLHYQPAVDESGHGQGDPAPIPVHVAGQKPNGDWLAVANLDLEGPHYMRLSAFWKGTRRCEGQEFLLTNFAIRPFTMSR